MHGRSENSRDIIEVSVSDTEKRDNDGFCSQLPPVSKVPGDVLSEIFSYFDLPDPYKARCYSNWIGSLSFSQVCRFWRQIAIADARLWVCSPFRFPSLAKEMIVRSRGCPLDVDLCLGAIAPRKVDDLSEVLGLTFGEDKNFKALRFSGMSRAQVDRYLPRLASSPYLEELHLGMSANPGESSNFPLITAPRLRCARLYNCIFPLHVQPLQYLTHLEIRSWGSYPATRLAVPMLLEFMAGAPNLENIELFHALQDIEVSNPSPSSIPNATPLLNLTYLKVTNSAMAIVELLRGIHLPPMRQTSTPAHSSSCPPLHEMNIWLGPVPGSVYTVVLDWNNGIAQTQVPR